MFGLIVFHILHHALPVHHITLVQYLSFQGWFTENNRNQYEYGNSNCMGQNGLPVEILHNYAMISAN
jgi:hypothetical protein